MNKARMQDQLVQVLKDAAEAHHEYEDGALKGKLDEQALGWYAGFVVGRLGNFATPSELTGWFHETRVRGKFELAAENILNHLEAKGGEASFAKPQRLSYNKATAEKQLVETLKAAADAHHEFEDNALKGQPDAQALGWYAGFTVGRLGDFATPSDLTAWFHETRVRGKVEIAAKNVMQHIDGPVAAPDFNTTAEKKVPDHLLTLGNALRAIDTLTIPAELASHHIEYDGPEYLHARFATMPQIYGFNTLPGHRVSEKVADADLVRFQFNLIANHQIGSGPYLDEKTARSVTYAKLFAAASGNTLITRPLYEEMLKAAVSPDFKPDIPAHASYSAGDVIPAAHWAQGLLDWEKNSEHKAPQLMPGEGMALINGGFVHVGVTLALVRKLHDFWGLFIDTSEQSFKLLGADTRVLDEPSTSTKQWFTDTMEHVKETLADVTRSSAVQDPVSIRTFPQQAQAAIFAFESLMTQTADVLEKPSGNPIMQKKGDGTLAVTPSGSFDQPALALATGNVIEALLMLGWNSVRRTVHMLDGDHANLPKDGVTDKDHLAMIQWPKLAQATLEELRGKYAAHNFTSGSSTSEEIEDFWTNGTETSLKAMELMGGVEKLLMIERLTAQRLNMVMKGEPCEDKITPRNINEASIAEAKSGIDYKKIPFPLKI